MKYVFLSILLAISLSASAQTTTGYLGPDTITAGQSATLYPVGTSWATNLQDLDKVVGLEVVVQVDSLSGATAGTAYVQYCYDDDCTITYNAATGTVNGVTTTLRTEDEIFNARKWRVVVTNTGATQSNKVQVVYSIKRRI